MKTFSKIAILCAAALFVAAPGCKKDADDSKPAPKKESGADAAKVTAILAKADLKDGTEDKVVHKCAACALRMDGSADNELAVHGYKMHFCSSGCKDGFAEDTDAAILAMNVE